MPIWKRRKRTGKEFGRWAEVSSNTRDSKEVAKEKKLTLETDTSPCPFFSPDVFILQVSIHLSTSLPMQQNMKFIR